MKLLHKSALVTGASGGIGRAMAFGLGIEGADVAINDLNVEGGAEELRKEIEGMGRKVVTIKADVSKSSEVEEMVNACLSVFGRIDILVNCAGIMNKTMVADMSEELWDRTMDINLKGTFLCCKAVMKDMMRRKSGKIVNVVSGRGVSGGFKAAHYAASKGGVIAFTKSLAIELAPYGINVNAVGPGPTDTELWRGGWTKEQIEAKLDKQDLLQRIGKPEDITGTLIYLVTDASQYVTGQVIFMKTP